uniref:DUF19 domain-containing protein n=1 Tax=Strongyloides venezuelensis TaxID=75913 RepID=A0A0K0F4K5_STRVS
MPLIDSNCSTFQNYYFLGNLTKTNESEMECKDKKEDCVYVSLDIPALAIGSFQSCSNKISEILTKIFDKRLDILDLFYKIKNNKTKLYEIDYFCKNFNSKVWEGNSMSGKIKLYTHCYKQNTIFNETNIIKFKPPISSAVPTLCYNDEEDYKTCTEGFCSDFQISYLTEPENYQQKISIVTCPNSMFNLLQDFNCDKLLHPSLKNDLSVIGEHCVSMDTFKKIVINGSRSYYFYVNCYNPFIVGNQTQPKIPVINNTNVDSSPQVEGNNNIAKNNSNQSSLLLYLVFFKTIKDYMENVFTIHNK